MIGRFRDLWRRVSMAQQSRLFKIVATIIVSLAALVILASSALAQARQSIDEEAGIADAQAPLAEPPQDFGEARRAISKMLGGQDRDVGVVLTTTIAAGISLVVIWLGLAITYLALIGASGAIAWIFGGVLGADGLSRLLLGMIALIASFAALLQGLRAAFSGRGPVFAIARNVLAEGVRLKLSVVFIILLVFALAAIPGLIDSQDALRYRVQSLLQYGTGGSFWIIALLIVLLSVATVAFDQRDRTIWQTMTKPVSAAQYIAGKWLGIAGLSAVLLGVCASGVFLFTDFIRGQTALGESQPYVSKTGSLISEDRMILESRILTARVAKKPDAPISTDSPEFLSSVESYIENQRKLDLDFAKDDQEFAEVVDSLYKSYVASRYRLVPGQWREFVFNNMGGARSSDRLITLHIKVKTSVNNPTHFYRLLFGWEGANSVIEKEVSLGTINRVEIPNDAVLDDGTLVVYVQNAGRTDDLAATEVLNVPEADGIEIAYSAGSYRMNFARVVFVLWIKLMFLSIISLTAATFLSFPVAVLMSLTVFLAAEGAGYIASSLESFRIQDQKGNTLVLNWITAQISEVISGLFAVYADLKPTTRLVEGRLLSWGDVGLGVLVLGAVSAAMFTLACLIFRRRELAMYSGH